MAATIPTRARRSTTSPHCSSRLARPARRSSISSTRAGRAACSIPRRRLANSSAFPNQARFVAEHLFTASLAGLRRFRSRATPYPSPGGEVRSVDRLGGSVLPPMGQEIPRNFGQSPSCPPVRFPNSKAGLVNRLPAAGSLATARLPQFIHGPGTPVGRSLQRRARTRCGRPVSSRLDNAPNSSRRSMRMPRQAAKSRVPKVES